MSKSGGGGGSGSGAVIPSKGGKAPAEPQNQVTPNWEQILYTPERITAWIKGEISLKDLHAISGPEMLEMAIIGFQMYEQAKYEEARIIFEGLTALDPKDPHYDPRSKSGESYWSMVDIRAIERLPRHVSLSEMRTKPELEGMPLLQKGSRLSVQKVGAAEWNAVLRLAKQTTG